MNQLGGFAPADPNNIIEYNGTFEAGKITGMWMIGEHMGEFEVELLSQKFTGATNFFPINWRLRLMPKHTLNIFGYCQDEHGVYILQGNLTGNTVRIVQ